MEDLTLQVALVDDVEVENPNRANPSSGKVDTRRRTQTAGADEQHLGVEELDLSRLTNFRKERVAAVGPLLVGTERLLHRELESFVLPAAKSPPPPSDLGVPNDLPAP